MDFQISVSGAGAFRRITLSLSGESQQPELSAIITSPSGIEEIFLPSPEKILANAAYPQSGGRFVTQIGKGRYQLIFQPKEAGPHSLKLVGRTLDRRRMKERRCQETPSIEHNLQSISRPFQKDFQINF
jgi:hypothetical protein